MDNWLNCNSYTSRDNRDKQKRLYRFILPPSRWRDILEKPQEKMSMNTLYIFVSIFPFWTNNFDFIIGAVTKVSISKS